MHHGHVAADRVRASRVCIVFLLAAACGCGSGSAPLDAPNGRTVAGVVFQEDQYFRLVEMGMKAAAAELDVALLTSNSANALDKEISLVDAYIVKQVDAIVVSPLSTKSSIPALKRAHDAGIKVVTYNTSVEAEFPVSFIESDQHSLGATTGAAARQYIEQQLGGRATVAMLEFQSLAPEQSTGRCAGFREALADLPGVDIVAEQDAWLAPDAATVTETILTRHPDLDLVWAANEGGAVGAVTAVRNTGKAGRVAVFGTDMSDQLASFLLDPDNVLQAVTGQAPFEIGRLALETAVKALDGRPVEAAVHLPGILFTRAKPDDIVAYKARIAELTR